MSCTLEGSSEISSRSSTHPVMGRRGKEESNMETARQLGWENKGNVRGLQQRDNRMIGGLIYSGRYYNLAGRSYFSL